MYLQSEHKVWLATGEGPVYLEPGMANRHGLIAGATGTGKTVTLKVLAESFSDMGVPVFLADIKGDLSVAVGHEGLQINRPLAGGEPDLVLRLQIHNVSSRFRQSLPLLELL